MSDQNKQIRGWHSRGYLPHFDGGVICQFVTLHLADALPQQVLTRRKAELEAERETDSGIILQQRIEKYLDQGYGACHLKNPVIAELTQKSLLFFDGEKYKLIAWVIMPNHIHFLLKSLENHSLSEIIHSIKFFISQEANKLLNRKGQFWQEDYFDRYIRNYEHFEKTLAYVEINPVKAGLCEKPAEWKFGSASLKTT